MHPINTHSNTSYQHIHLVHILISGGGNISSDDEGGSSNDSDEDNDSDSDSDSVSSDDSDVKTVQSPLSPAWMSWSVLSNNVSALYDRAKGIITSTHPTNLPTPSTSLTTIESGGGSLSLTTPTQETASTRLWDKVTTTSVETMQWALLQTGAGVAVVAGSIWNRINNALQRYVNETIDNNTGGGRGRPPSRELTIAPSTTRDAMAP